MPTKTRLRAVHKVNQQFPHFSDCAVLSLFHYCLFAKLIDLGREGQYLNPSRIIFYAGHDSIRYISMYKINFPS